MTNLMSVIQHIYIKDTINVTSRACQRVCVDRLYC